VGWNAMGLGIVKAAQHKLAGLLAEKLRGDGIYVGEVMVLGVVKGTAFDAGQGTIEADAVAAKFWDLYSRRSPPFAQIGCREAFRARGGNRRWRPAAHRRLRTNGRRRRGRASSRAESAVPARRAGRTGRARPARTGSARGSGPGGPRAAAPADRAGAA